MPSKTTFWLNRWWCSLFDVAVHTCWCIVLYSKLGQEATALFKDTMPSRVIEPAVHARQETLSLPEIVSDLYQWPLRVSDRLSRWSAPPEVNRNVERHWRGGHMNQDADIYWKYKPLREGRTSIAAFNQQNEPDRKQKKGTIKEKRLHYRWI